MFWLVARALLSGSGWLHTGCSLHKSVLTDAWSFEEFNTGVCWIKALNMSDDINNRGD